MTTIELDQPVTGAAPPPADLGERSVTHPGPEEHVAHDDVVLPTFTDEELAAVSVGGPEPVPLAHADALTGATRDAVLLAALRSLGARGYVTHAGGDRVRLRGALAEVVERREQAAGVSVIELFRRDQQELRLTGFTPADGATILLEDRTPAGCHHFRLTTHERLAAALLQRLGGAAGPDGPACSPGDAGWVEVARLLDGAIALLRVTTLRRHGPAPLQAGVSIAATPVGHLMVTGWQPEGGPAQVTARRLGPPAAAGAVLAALLPVEPDHTTP